MASARPRHYRKRSSCPRRLESTVVDCNVRIDHDRGPRLRDFARMASSSAPSAAAKTSVRSGQPIATLSGTQASE